MMFAIVLPMHQDLANNQGQNRQTGQYVLRWRAMLGNQPSQQRRDSQTDLKIGCQMTMILHRRGCHRQKLKQQKEGNDLFQYWVK